MPADALLPLATPQPKSPAPSASSGKRQPRVRGQAWRTASTAFWVDPAEENTALSLTQLLPSGNYPLRSRLRQFVYQALIDWAARLRAAGHPRRTPLKPPSGTS